MWIAGSMECSQYRSGVSLKQTCVIKKFVLTKDLWAERSRDKKTKTWTWTKVKRERVILSFVNRSQLQVWQNGSNSFSYIISGSLHTGLNTLCKQSYRRMQFESRQISSELFHPITPVTSQRISCRGPVTDSQVLRCILFWVPAPLPTLRQAAQPGVPGSWLL